MNRAILVLLTLTGCGGEVTSPLFDGGTTDAASDGAPASEGGSSCDTLIQELAGQTPNAVQCCPTCNVPQCSVQVAGLCCPLTVTDATADAVKIYEATLAQIKAQGCSVSCPAIACSTKPTDNCTQSSSCAQ